MAQGKLDFKMLVVPAILLVSRQVNLKDESIVQLLQTGLVTVAVIVMTIHGLIYMKVTSSKNSKKIWVPPKPKPQLPFGLGGPEETVKASDYEETTITDYEVKLMKESAGSVCMSFIIALVMSYKFNIHMSLMIQAVMLPLNMFDNPCLKKYLLGTFTKVADRPYNEEYSAPTEETIAAKALANTVGATASTAAPIGKDEPRVEELSADDKKDTTSTSTATATKSTPTKSSSGADLD